jgi:hypothetical protein
VEKGIEEAQSQGTVADGEPEPNGGAAAGLDLGTAVPNWGQLGTGKRHAKHGKTRSRPVKLLRISHFSHFSQ